MTLAEPVFMAFAVFSSVDECKAFAKYYDLARIFEPQCVEMGGEADYRRPIPNIKPRPRPEQEQQIGNLGRNPQTSPARKNCFGQITC